MKMEIEEGIYIIEKPFDILQIKEVAKNTLDAGEESKKMRNEIIERKQIEEELIRARELEAIACLASGIAHDFNNLLAGVMGNISLAKRNPNLSKADLEILTSAENACRQARDLTHYLLGFAKGGEPVKKPTSLPEFIKEAVISPLRGFDVICEFSLPANLWLVEIDEEQMERAIQNIIMNACEAMPDGGVITVRAENVVFAPNGFYLLEEGKYAKISVIDQGIGIPEDHLQRVFNPYFTTKKMDRTKGTGLGLSICYSIIKKHDGHITAESDGRAGSAFHIYLPAVATATM